MTMRVVWALALAAALSGCGILGPTSAFHVNPVTKGYGEGASDAGFEFQTSRAPFDLDTECLPGLGGGLMAGEDGEKRLVCETSAVEAIMALARGEADAKRQLAYTTNAAGIQVDRSQDSYFQSRLGRNRLQEYLVSRSHDICDLHKAAMFAKITSANLGLDLATIGLAAASTIVTGTDATRILAGLAATTAGGRASLNENLVQNQLVTAITKAIDVNREKALTLIRQRQSRDLDTYTVEAAIADVALYHQECSIYAGLATLPEAVDRLKASRQDYLRRAQDLLDFAKENSDLPTEMKDTVNDGVAASLQAASEAPAKE